VKRLLVCGLVVAAGCSDALEQDTTAGQVVAVVSALDRTISLVSVSNLTVRSLDLSAIPGYATSIAARGSTLIVPFANGSNSSVAVFDLAQAGGASPFVIPVPTAQPVAVAIENDSIAWVPASGSGLVARVNYRTGTVTSVTAGTQGSAVAVARGKVFVASPDDSIRVIDPASVKVVDSLGLAGRNPTWITVGGDSLLYISDVDPLGGTDGSVSIVDPVTDREVVLIRGLGFMEGTSVYHPSGRLLVAAQANGILEINTLTRSLVRGPGEGIRPPGSFIGGLTLDARGRVYAIDWTDCRGPGVVHVLAPPPGYGEQGTAAVGACPRGSALATMF